MAIATVPRLSVPPAGAWYRRIAARLRPKPAFNTTIIHRNQATALPAGGAAAGPEGPALASAAIAVASGAPG
jgi:hypothetical protein